MSRLGALRTLALLEPRDRTFAMAAWVLATPVGLSVRVLGFRRLEALLARVPTARASRAAAAVDVERAEALVTRAFVRSLGPRGCLPQSIVQCLVHRALGREVDLVIGVRRDAAEAAGQSHLGFGAHAWVEERGGPKREVGHLEIWRSP